MQLVNKVTGATLSVDERTARRLGAEWEAVKRSPARKPARKGAPKPEPKEEPPADADGD